MTEGLLRISSADVSVCSCWITEGKPLWVDHVMLDIPATLAAAVRSADPLIRAITVHEWVVVWRYKYKEMFEICERRGIAVMVALDGTFERVPLDTYLGGKPCGKI